MATVDLHLIITAVNRAGAALAGVWKGIDEVDKKAKSTTRSLRAMDIVLASIATGSAVAVGKAVLDTASKMEKARLRLAFFEKGFEGGAKAFGELRKQFEGVPMETEAMLQGFTKMKAAGIDPLNGSLRTLFDTVSVFGGGTAEFERALNAIVQVSGKGQLMREELQGQLAEAIPFARKLIMDGLGMNSQELNAAMAKGLVGAKDAIEAFFREAQKKFAGFSALMAQTIEGGQASIKKAWQDMITKVIVESGVSTRIGMFLNGIAQKIADFANSVTPEQINSLVEFFKDIIRFAAGAGQAILRVTEVVIGFVAAITNSLGSLGGDILVSGFIGKILFGRFGTAGAIVGAVLPLVARMFKGTGVLAHTMIKDIEAVLGDAMAFGMVGYMLFGKKGALIGAVLGSFKNDFMSWIDSAVIGWARITDAIGLTEGRAQNLANIVAKMRAGGESATAKFFSGGTPGGPFSSGIDVELEKLLSLTDGYQGVLDAQNQFMKNAPSMNATLENAQSGSEAAARAAEKALRAQRQAAQREIEAARAVMDLRRISFDTTDVRLSQTQMPFSSSAVDQERQDQRRHMEEILNVKVRILEAQKDMIGATAEQKKIFETQIVALQNYQSVLETAAANTTAQAILMRETWTSVGDAISDSAKRGLSAFAQGTLSVQSLISDLYSTLTDLAASYLVELVKIQALKAATAGGMGAGGTGFFGGLMGAVGSFFGGGFANGGVFPSGTTMSSGLLRGPHAFGIGGESGPEAVLPLRRVGGQLGVAAAGGGGNTTIVIQAFDTQAAVDVLMQNSRAMNTALVGNRNLEKSSV